jgi:hypothetical protein
MAGRPSAYDPGIGDKVLEMLASGLSLRAICQEPQLPSECTVRRRVLDDNAFATQYARARNIGLDCLADRMLELAETPVLGEKTVRKADGGIEITTGDTVDRSRLAVDAIKWQLSKMRPDKYGDRLQVAGDKDAPLEVNVSGLELLNSRISRIAERKREGGSSSGTI